MKGQTHIVAVPEPIKTWPDSIIALCQKSVKNPRPVMAFDVQEHELFAGQTIRFCPECGKLLPLISPEITWLYGVHSGQTALDEERHGAI